MNVYLVMEDGESRVFAASNMAAATEAAWQDALRDETERRGAPLNDAEALEERNEWEVDVLQSVTLVGELENYEDLLQRSANGKSGEPT